MAFWVSLSIQIYFLYENNVFFIKEKSQSNEVKLFDPKNEKIPGYENTRIDREIS